MSFETVNKSSVAYKKGFNHGSSGGYYVNQYKRNEESYDWEAYHKGYWDGYAERQERFKPT